MKSSRAFVLLLSAAASAQDPAPVAKPDKPDKEVAEKLAMLKEVVEDRKCSRDAEGLDLITHLVQKWQGGLVDKDKRDIVKGFESALLKGKLREPDKTQLYIAAATALGLLGTDGSKPLQAAFKDERFPDKEPWVPLRETLLKSLGKTKDESTIKFLLNVARRDPQAQLQAAAGEALGNFEESKAELRKDIVNSLIITYGEMDSRSRVIDPADIEAQNMVKRLAVVSGKWNDTLRKLTKQNFDNYPEWNEWYNKNKAKDWN
jgi:hypothetical protein